MLSVKRSVKRLTDRLLLPEAATIDIVNLLANFKPDPGDSLQAILKLLNQIADSALPPTWSARPYFLRRMPSPQDVAKYDSDGRHIDLRNVNSHKILRLAPRKPMSSTDRLTEAIAAFDARAASVILDSANPRYIRDLQSLAGSPLGDWDGHRVTALRNALVESWQ
jgi:hypothetical protein